MERMVDLGLTRGIGVSNYSVRQLRKTMAVARIPPSVLQTEVHVCYQQRELLQFCRQQGVTVVAYGVLGSPGRGDDLQITCHRRLALLEEPVVALVAAHRRCTAAAVLLQWARA